MLTPKRVWILSVGFFGVSFFMQNFARGALVDELNPNQLQQLRQGQQVFTTEKISGIKWSKLYFYEIVNATPAEAAAVTMDWAQKRNYTIGLLKSEVTQTHFGGADVIVDYTVKVPLVGTENFTMKNKMESYDNGQSFKTSSTLVRADRTRASEGSTQFESFEGATLIKVVSQTDPPNIIGIGLAEKTAINQTLEAYADFGKHVVDEKTNAAELLKKQIQELEDAMALLQASSKP